MVLFFDWVLCLTQVLENFTFSLFIQRKMVRSLNKHQRKASPVEVNTRPDYQMSNNMNFK